MINILVFQWKQEYVIGLGHTLSLVYKLMTSSIKIFLVEFWWYYSNLWQSFLSRHKLEVHFHIKAIKTYHLTYFFKKHMIVKVGLINIHSKSKPTLFGSLNSNSLTLSSPKCDTWIPQESNYIRNGLTISYVSGATWWLFFALLEVALSFW